MNKEKYLADRKVLTDAAQALIDEGKLEEFEAKKKEIEDLDTQYENEAKAQANLNSLNDKVTATNLTNFSKEVDGGTVVDVMNLSKTPEIKDMYDTDEYKQAFMNFACRGVPIPANLTNASQTTESSDVTAVVPTTIMKEIISEMKTYGNIYAKVRKINVKGGVSIPILSIKPTATWVGEGASDSRKVSSTKSVIFNYYGLECKIAQSLLVNVTTLDMFQDLFVPLAAEAIVETLEKSIISGDGSGKCLGIVNDTRIPTKNIINISEADIGEWGLWKKNVFAKMKKSYRKGDFIFAQATFDTYIDGMTDTTGQPIGRINYGIDGGETYRFGGKTVEIVEDDVIAPFDEAAAGDVIGVFVDLNNYAVNTNMQMQTVRWIDHDTNEVKNKCLVIVDGKLVDPNGVIILKKVSV